MNELSTQIKSHFQEIFPEREIIWSILDENLWYIFAPSVDPSEGMMNPYFTSNEQGQISEFYVIQNLEKFEQILAKLKSS